MADKIKTESERLNEDIEAIDRVIDERSAEKGSKRHMEAVRRHIHEMETKRDLLIEMHRAAVREERASRKPKMSVDYSRLRPFMPSYGEPSAR